MINKTLTQYPHDTEANPEALLLKIKKKYYKDKVYIFECNHCSNMILLNWKSCNRKKCKAINDFYDSTIEVEKKVEKRVIEELDLYFELKENPIKAIREN